MNLLLVDDEAFALEALQNAVDWHALGIDQVFSCNNITSAKELCTHADIHLMICDIEMPNGTGIDLAHWIFENHPDILILFLTCHSDFFYAREAIQYHAFAYLLKPFDIEELSNTVRDAVQQINASLKQKNGLQASQKPAERLLAAEHFWQQLVRGIYQNSDTDYLSWNARQKGVFFDPSLRYVPILFYIVSIPSPDTDLGILSYCIKNAVNELFLDNKNFPPALELEPRFFLALLAEASFPNPEQLQNKCNELIAFFRRKFQITLQVLTGNAVDHTTLPRQTALLTSQASAALKNVETADEHEKSEQIVRKIMELVKKDKTITREELAGQVYLSPDYMAKIFKKETGKKISDYLSEVKLEEAKYRLSSTNQSISQIASALSYSNFSYFSRMFKTETGMSPGEYRKRYRKADSTAN